MVSPEGSVCNEAVEWLANTKVLGDEKNRINRTSDLAAILRDGSMLCRLANIFQYGCIDSTQIFFGQQSQKSRFLCSNNIRLFLEACRHTFHIPETELFEENDLYDLEDFGRVLRLLSLLSHTEQAKKLLRPFSVLVPNHHDLYSNLRDDVEKTVDESIYDVVQSNYAREESEKEHQIYDTIVVHASSKVSSKDTWTSFKPSTQREHCIKELLDTEANYVEQALDMILSRFHLPLRNVLSSEDMEAIFINIDEIATFHRAFLLKLRRAVLITLGFEQRHPSDTEPRIGDVFINNKKRFIIYARYCSLLNASRARIEEIERTDPAKKKRISELTDEANRCQFKLQDLLSVPMQRILKYHLLLEQLIKNTSFDDPDYQNLIDARDVMSDVNHYINEVKRDHESIEIIRSIERSIIDLSLPDTKRISDYGRLHLDGLVKLVDHDNHTIIKPKPRYVFIFDKMILICKALKNNQYEFKTAYGVRDWTISEVETDNSYKANTITRKFTASLFDNTSLYLTKKQSKNHDSSLQNSTGNSIQIVLKTVAQRNQWKAAIKTAIENNDPPEGVAKGHRLSYDSYSEVKTCGVCTKLLCGKFFQGYTCLRCRMVMHRGCAAVAYCGGGRSSSSFSDRHSIADRHSVEENGFATPFARNERVIALQSVKSADPTVLNFKSGDAIEVVEINPDGNTFFGRLVDLPGKSGLVRCDCVRSVGIDFHRRLSSTSIMNTPNTPLTDLSPMDRPKEVLKTAESSNVMEQPWFFGEIEREKANELLEKQDDGTFIVRYSPTQRQFVVSVYYSGRPKHMKIETEADTGRYYLHDGRTFASVVELINFYRENNLSEGFTNLDTTLTGTLLRTTRYRAMHEFRGTDAAKYLEFRRGDVIEVVDTLGEDKGWWKGKLGDRIGFFPMTYVERMDSSSDETLTDVSVQLNGMMRNGSTTLVN